jgi:alginate O-acetyltransferase complex protein AlgI
MQFNSINFIVFFSVVFLVYYSILDEKTKLQNWFLLLSSYFFYGFADIKMLSVIICATLIFFYLGKCMENKSNSSLCAKIGVFLGIGLLVYFKYMNFFIESLASLLNTIGLKTNLGTFDIIMPLGISFFTFKLISYVVEINRGKIEPAQDLVAFATYVAFFPTILSGPIDRPNSFIPQLLKKRVFDYSLAVVGSKQILWGLFQKVVIADNLAIYTNEVWANISDHSGSTLLLIAVLYTFQLYTDFSGYSHMAIGVGKLLGFRVTANFNYPFFSRNIAEYWRKWHISLTSWLTDYVFMPLNVKFRNLGKVGIILAIIINMVVVGLWHGANITFVVFGFYHGLLFIPIIISGRIFRKTKTLTINKYDIPKLSDFVKIVGTFMQVTIGLIIFRANNIGQAWVYFSKIFSKSLFSIPELQGSRMQPGESAMVYIGLIIYMLLIEWGGRDRENPIERWGHKYSRIYRMSFYSLFLFLIGMYSQTSETPFIYFQF